jgi:hypothetical protein
MEVKVAFLEILLFYDEQEYQLIDSNQWKFNRVCDRSVIGDHEKCTFYNRNTPETF